MSRIVNNPFPLTTSNLNGNSLCASDIIGLANPMDNFFENCKNLNKAKISVTWEKNDSSFQMMLWENGNMIVTKDGQPVEQSDLTEEEVLFYIKMKRAIGAQ